MTGTEEKGMFVCTGQIRFFFVMKKKIISGLFLFMSREEN